MLLLSALCLFVQIKGVSATPPTIMTDYKDATCHPASPLDTTLATADGFDDEAKRIIDELHDGTFRMHRKQWEFVYIVKALRYAGMLVPGKKALVFAAGREPLISYFASKGVEVVATDMDPDAALQKGWVTTNQHSRKKDNLYRQDLISYSEFAEKVHFRTLDMNDITKDLYHSFDFVWSTCSLEHVGSIALGKLFLLKSALLLRRGGIAVHTTEFTLSSNLNTVARGPTVLWRRSDVEEARADLAAFGFEPAGICLHSGNADVDITPDLPPFRHDGHMKLLLGEHVVTSIGFTFKNTSDVR